MSKSSVNFFVCISGQRFKAWQVLDKLTNVNRGKYYRIQCGQHQIPTHMSFLPTVIRQISVRYGVDFGVPWAFGSHLGFELHLLGTYRDATSMDCWSALGCFCHKASRRIWWVASIFTKLVPFSYSHMKAILTTNQNVTRQQMEGRNRLLRSS